MERPEVPAVEARDQARPGAHATCRGHRAMELQKGPGLPPCGCSDPPLRRLPPATTPPVCAAQANPSSSAKFDTTLAILGLFFLPSPNRIQVLS